MKRRCILLAVILLATKPTILSAASIYNSDFKPRQIQVKYKDGSQYHVTVYNSSTHYFRCKYGCQIKVLKTGATITLNSDTVVLIDDGKLRVR